MIITCSERGSVAMVIQDAMRMRPIILLSVTFFTLSHTRRDFRGGYRK